MPQGKTDAFQGGFQDCEEHAQSALHDQQSGWQVR